MNDFDVKYELWKKIRWGYKQIRIEWWSNILNRDVKNEFRSDFGSIEFGKWFIEAVAIYDTPSSVIDAYMMYKYGTLLEKSEVMARIIGENNG